jgi:hypothetical protein
MVKIAAILNYFAAAGGGSSSNLACALVAPLFGSCFVLFYDDLSFVELHNTR